MLHDYKGETPKNVMTEEEHKKRPFYKKVSFWVLSALGFFFGGCSVYGLVLGYQYVHAVTEAAHIIADANDSNESEGVKANVRSLNQPSGVPDNVSFDFTIDDGFQEGRYLLTGEPWVSGNDQATVTFTPASVGLVITLWYGNAYRMCWADYVTDVTFTNIYYSADYYAPFGSYIATSRPATFSGVMHYKPIDVATSSAYQEGFDDGYEQGYDQGLADGAQSLDQNQTVILRGTHPSTEDLYHTFNYSVTINGAAVYTGTLTGNQTFSFSRLVGDLVAIDISPTETLESRYSLSASCNVGFWPLEYPEPSTGLPVYKQFIHDGYFYLPTNYRQVFINLEGFVSVGGAPFGLAIPTTFALTRDGNVYSQFGYYFDGYNAGYSDGLTAGDNYQSGKEDGLREGYDQGFEDGKTIGIAQGEAQAVGGQKALVNMFVTAFQQPFDQIYRFLNFNVLGLNILALFTALLTLSIGIIIIKKVI